MGEKIRLSDNQRYNLASSVLGTGSKQQIIYSILSFAKSVAQDKTARQNEKITKKQIIGAILSDELLKANQNAWTKIQSVEYELTHPKKIRPETRSTKAREESRRFGSQSGKRISRRPGKPRHGR